MPVSVATLNDLVRAAGSAAALVPVAPPRALGKPGGSFKDVGMGKAPALFNPAEGLWYGDASWRQGHDIGVLLDRCITPGGNIGLNLSKGFAALDWDGVGHLHHLAEAFVAAVEQCLGRAIEHRRTVPGRCALLFSIDGAVPKKATWLLRHGADDWKLELLGDGQQIVIAGTHPSGNPIGWRGLGDNASRTAPDLARTPAVDMDTLLSVVEAALRVVTDQHGVQVLGASGASTASPPLAPEDQAPPDVALLVRALKTMGNPATTTRDQYVQVMMATAGCLHALRSLGRVTGEQEEQVEHAVASWAARWEGDNAGDYAAERTKFTSDFMQQPVTHLGWHWLRDFAQARGAADVREAEAQGEFVPVGPPPEPPRDEITGAVVECPIEAKPGLPSHADTAIARGIWRAARDVLAFDTFSERWMRWTGTAWVPSAGHQGVEAQLVARNLIARYAQDRGFDWTDAQMSRVFAAERGPSVLNILKGALAPPVEFSRNVFGLQTPGGAYDLRTGEAVTAAAARAWFDGRCTSVNPAEGEAPLFDAMLLHLCNGDEDMKAWLWRCLGYSLLGQPRAQVFLSLVGQGATGKSTLIDTMVRVLGSYAGVVDADVLTARGAAQHKASLFRLHNLRFAAVAEMDQDGGAWNEPRLKALTAGDLIEARQMFGSPVTFRFQGLLLVAGQRFPQFRQVDNAIARRVRIIGTETPVPEHQRDTRLLDKLIAREAPMILHRLMAEARASYADGCGLPVCPRRMQVLTDEVLDEMDPFAAWSKARTQFGPAAAGAETAVCDLLADFKAWAEQQTDSDVTALIAGPLSQEAFGQRLRGLAGVETRKPDGTRLRKRYAHTGAHPVAYARHIRLRS